MANDKIKVKQISLEVDADASDQEILDKLGEILKEYRTDVNLAKGHIVLTIEDKEP